MSIWLNAFFFLDEETEGLSGDAIGPQSDPLVSGSTTLLHHILPPQSAPGGEIWKLHMYLTGRSVQAGKNTIPWITENNSCPIQ